jgi:dihydropteroate synthase-like protein
LSNARSNAVNRSLSPGERVLFITGRLAEGLVRRVVDDLTASTAIDAEVRVVGISVAALMHVGWLKRKLTLDEPYDRAVVPGWCQGDLRVLEAEFGIPFERGPKDVLDLPEFFGQRQREGVDLSGRDIEIIAEINHAPRLSDAEILAEANRYRDAGADVIDVGCIPGECWPRCGEVVRLLREEGLRVSIDSFDRREVEEAVAAGAELVLSCNGSNVEWASRLGAELVVIPDRPDRLDSMWSVAEHVAEAGCRYRVDPILEPIGFGFAASLARYFEVRRRDPQVPVMMGIGNLTEMTAVDSAGINMLLAGICQELGIFSVLTTQVINWCRTAVAEFDLARRMVKHAIDHRTLPKRLSEDLVVLRDPVLVELGEETLQDVAGKLKDPNFRIFVERDEIHVMNRDGYWRGTDPFELFDRFSVESPGLDAAHAFYLGFELANAVTALRLGKQYRQDQPLRWGLLGERGT